MSRRHQDWPHVQEALIEELQGYVDHMPQPELSSASAEDTLKYFAALKGAQGVVDLLKMVRRRQQIAAEERNGN